MTRSKRPRRKRRFKMKSEIKEMGLLILGIFVAGALLNLLNSMAVTKPVANYITKGYGSLA
jgi:hypothetical protein